MENILAGVFSQISIIVRALMRLTSFGHINTFICLATVPWMVKENIIMKAASDILAMMTMTLTLDGDGDDDDDDGDE